GEHRRAVEATRRCRDHRIQRHGFGYFCRNKSSPLALEASGKKTWMSNIAREIEVTGDKVTGLLAPSMALAFGHRRRRCSLRHPAFAVRPAPE
ncbi:MAG TPA: hypothetical protein VJ727_04040, partial [Rhodanobacteraceae bacterium]|nr:hypothetical protein [Rhodanobacteraceae bacterium]